MTDDDAATYDGGPAFPTPCDKFGEHSASMSLRDWFAGQALVGLAATDGTEHRTPAYSTTLAYVYADAMLKAREDAP